jgi:heptaprenyl diphosphate synthase
LLSTLEYLIPKPLPFIRIGLANLPLLLILDRGSPRQFALLTLIKIAGAGILGGTIFSYVFIFSLGGGLASALVMYGLGLVRRAGPRMLRPGLGGVGAAGALCSTAVQLLLARFLVFGEGIRYLIPPLLTTALITGFALGLFCEYFCRRSRWYARFALLGDPGMPVPAEDAAAVPRRPGPEAPSGPAGRDSPRRCLRRGRWDSLFDTRELVAAGFLAALLFLSNPSTLGRSLQLLLFWFCAWASGRKNRPLLTLLVIAGVALVNLLAPYGRVLAEIGPFPVTAGSLATGLRKGITLEGLFMLSGAVVRVRGGRAGRRPGKPAGSGGFRGGRIYRRLSSRITGFCDLLGESLAVFALLRDGGVSVRPGRLVEDIDGLLLGMGGPFPEEPPRTGAAGGNRSPRKDGGSVPPGGPRRGRLPLVLGLLVIAALTVLPACTALP